MPDQVNAQIIDSMLVNNETVLSDSVAESQGVTLESYAYSISLFMINAVNTQNAAAQIGNAAVVSACAQILRAAVTSG
jgi:hypothetical protein